MESLQELEQHIPDVIDQMPARFNSHEFILKLGHQHQDAYVRALAHYADTGRPFGVLHGLLAQRLEQKFSHLVRIIGTEPSHDIFGHSSTVTVWGRIQK